jgi:hypothetical protein
LKSLRLERTYQKASLVAKIFMYLDSRLGLSVI